MRVRHRALRRSRGSLQVGSLPHSRGVGVCEAGSKLTESIACELLSASSVVTHGGSQASGEGEVMGSGGGEKMRFPPSLLLRPSLISSC